LYAPDAVCTGGLEARHGFDADVEDTQNMGALNVAVSASNLRRDRFAAAESHFAGQESYESAIIAI
jgi:hypothetical protein